MRTVHLKRICNYCLVISANVSELVPLFLFLNQNVYTSKNALTEFIISINSSIDFSIMDLIKWGVVAQKWAVAGQKISGFKHTK